VGKHIHLGVNINGQSQVTAMTSILIQIMIQTQTTHTVPK